MGNDIRDLILRRLGRDSKKQDAIEVTKGLTMGIDNSNDSSVSARPGFIWVKEESQSGAIFQAFNQSVKTLVGLPVLVARDRVPPFRRVVIGIDWDVLPTTTYAGQAYEIVNHATSHEWQDTLPGLDAMTVYPRSWAPFRVYPMAGLTVGVAKGYYIKDGILTSYIGDSGLDLSGYIPAADYNKIVLAYFQLSDGTVHFLAGDPTYYTDPYDYPVAVADTFSLCYILMTSTLTQISEANIIIDLRTPFILSSYNGAAPSTAVLNLVGALADELDMEITRHKVEGL
jgi:hypothetical protein